MSDYDDTGTSNNLELSDDKLLINIQNIQLANGLPQYSKLNSMDFSVEMETGTAKHMYISKLSLR